VKSVVGTSYNTLLKPDLNILHAFSLPAYNQSLLKGKQYLEFMKTKKDFIKHPSSLVKN
jgi:hypothetical protein